MEKALIENLAGISVRRVEDITEALWVSNAIRELNKNIEDWQNHPLQGGSIRMSTRMVFIRAATGGGEFANVAILVAITVNEDECCEVLGTAESIKEDKAN